jgi:hypothetical protein
MEPAPQVSRRPWANPVTAWPSNERLNEAGATGLYFVRSSETHGGYRQNRVMCKARTDNGLMAFMGGAYQEIGGMGQARFFSPGLVAELSTEQLF